MSEQWRDIPGLDGYQVSDLGNVRSFRTSAGPRHRLKEPRPMKPHLNKYGYPQLGLRMGDGRQKQFTVHTLVAAAFLGPRPVGMQTAHADGIKTNNCLANLRYATPLENAADKELHGTWPRGEMDGNAKLTAADVLEIRRRYALGERQVDLAAAFGVGDSQISNITRRAAWAHLADEGAA